MQQRVIGVGLAAIAVLLVLVAARAGGVPVAGSAIAPPGLSAPAVGDCVLAVTGDFIQRATDAGTSADSVGERSVTFAGCSGPHVGEVVAYRRMAQQSEAAAVQAPAQVTDRDWCSQVSADYGAHEIWRFAQASGGLWVPATGQRFITVLSTPQSDPTEPRWAACAVFPPGLESYQGSYLGWLADGAAPKPYGRCVTGAGGAPVSCLEPHRAQEFGSGIDTAPAAQAGATCLALITAMTRMDDVTVDGALRIDIGQSTDDVPPNGVTDRTCRLSLVGEGQLNSTMIGIGDNPLPLV